MLVQVERILSGSGASPPAMVMPPCPPGPQQDKPALPRRPEGRSEGDPTVGCSSEASSYCAGPYPRLSYLDQRVSGILPGAHCSCIPSTHCSCIPGVHVASNANVIYSAVGVSILPWISCFPSGDISRAWPQPCGGRLVPSGTGAPSASPSTVGRVHTTDSIHYPTPLYRDTQMSRHRLCRNICSTLWRQG